MILAGDIGGTNTRIALFSQEGGRLTMQQERNYPSGGHKSLEEIVNLFLRAESAQVEVACFGIAGPVLNGKAFPANIPWVVDSREISQRTAIANVWLINDLQAHAYGTAVLEPTDLIVLNSGQRRDGNAALIAAGTGLGEAGMYWDGAEHYAFAGEGGHADWAPVNELELALHGHLMKRFGHVSCERVLSGPGIKNIYDFLRDSKTEPEPPWLKAELDQAADPVVLISQYGLEGKAAICEHALDIFVSVYGAEAGNLALRLMAVGGVFVSGGIAGKILSKMQGPLFMKAFVEKGRLQSLMETVPVHLIINEHIGVLGSARYAFKQQQRIALARG